MGVTIRPAAAADAGAIAAVHVAAWRWAYRGLVADAALQALSMVTREGMWREIIPLGGVVAAVDGDQVVGFVAYGATEQSGTGDAGEVFAIYLLEGWTGMGIGHTLITRATEGLRALGFDRATLWVLEANTRARRFYEAVGWRSDGVRGLCDIGGAAYAEVRYTMDL
jgi:ribosomal protein S18 acetylase RimI-like enzyme